MKPVKVIIFAAVMLACVFASYELAISLNKGFIPPLKIIGDIENPYIIKSVKDFKTSKISINNKKVKAFSLKDIVDKAKPIGKNKSILIVGDDGLTAKINGESIDDCYIAFTAENGWEAVNYNHPVSSNIKRIKEIVSVSEDTDVDFGINIISPQKDILHITPGQLYLKKLTKLPYFEGKSNVQNNGKSNSVEIYTMRSVIKLKELVSFNSQILVMGEKGSYGMDDGDGYLEIKDNTINYMYPDMKQTVKDVRGIIVQIPHRSVMDTYYDAQHYLETGEKVMIIYLDGFGYEQYKYAVDNNCAPYLKSLTAADMASSVYTPVTNAGFAAMITGKSPQENGVYSREQKDLKTPSIFDEVKKLNKTSALIEGNIKILNTEIDPELNLDKNNNGATDDEVYESALKKIGGNYDLLLVHFHGIDDSGHDYGDINEKTMDTVKKIDGYVKELAKGWNGKIIITADHGMHSVIAKDQAGDHGKFTHNDMIVPYIITSGGVIK